MATYRVGVIGRTGHGNYGHGVDTVWSAVPRTRVVAVADDDPEGLQAATVRTGAAKGYADYRDMLAAEKLDIVALCPRWLDRHHEIALACAEHGCHVYMEKPFVRSLEEADAVVAAFEMRHLKLAIAHTNRYTPQLDVARGLIAAGAIGDVLELRARGKEDARRGGGEDLWVLGTHMLDLMRALVGDVDHCFAMVRQDGQPVREEHVVDGNEGIGPLAGDSIDASYRFKSGAVGYFGTHRGQAGSPSRFGLKVFGSKGVIEFESGFLKTAYLLQDSSWSPGRSGKEWVPISSNGPGKPETREPGAHRGNLPAVEDLIESIEQDRQPRSNVYDARAATEMIAGVFESHRLGKPVQFPLQNRRNPLTLLR